MLSRGLIQLCGVSLLTVMPLYTYAADVAVGQGAKIAPQSVDNKKEINDKAQNAVPAEAGLAQKLYAPQAVAAQYPKGEASPVFLKAFTLAQMNNVVAVLSESWRHGMNPETYRAGLLAAELKKPGAMTSIDLDRLMMDSLARYIGDMTGMRVRAASLGLRAQDWRQPLDPAVALAALRAAKDPAAYLQSLAPQSRLYARLQTELEDLRDDIAAGKGNQPIYPFQPLKRLLRPGDQHPEIADLRERLGVHMPESGNANEYDDRLAQVVMQFQRNHGLKDDGVIGPQTIQFFNQTYFQRYRQVVANLERVRWLNPEKPKKYIVVNIPAATLWAVEGDEVKLEMPVIVGRKKRATSQFQTEVVGVRFNPTWTVPGVIKKEDFLPELQKDPSFLNSKGIEVWRHEGKESVRIDPAYVDWANITEKELGQFRMVQPSGRSNALGKIRVLMPNQYGIYLHDTNTPQYFRDDNRTISSGCVRLSRPRDIARFVLDGVEGWSDAKMKDALSSDKTRDIQATPRFPVILLYQTAWLKKDGNLVLAYDIYEEDIKLYDALQRQDLLPKFSK